MSHSFVSLLQILGYEEIQSVKDLVSQDSPKYIDDLIMGFSLHKYLLEKAQKKTHERLEDFFFLDLSKFKEF